MLWKRKEPVFVEKTEADKNQCCQGRDKMEIEMIVEISRRIDVLEAHESTRKYERRCEHLKSLGCLDPEAAIVLMDKAETDMLSGYGHFMMTMTSAATPEGNRMRHPTLWKPVKNKEKA